MSRSYKKNLIWKDTSGTGYRRFAKNQANRTVRRAKDVPDGKAYRKFYDPWNITDWYYRYDPYPTWYDWKQEWVEPDPVWKWRCK